METINKTTKRGQRFINGYNRSRKTDLYDCYGRFSCEKARAQRDCREKMEREGGEDFRIIGYNSCAFSCGWMTAEGLRVETVGGSYIVK